MIKAIDFWATIVYTCIMGYKSGVNIMSPKTGRPTDNKKGTPIHVRLDEKTTKILNDYTLQKNISRAEAIRRGIVKLESELKK